MKNLASARSILLLGLAAIVAILFFSEEGGRLDDKIRDVKYEMAMRGICTFHHTSDPQAADLLEEFKAEVRKLEAEYEAAGKEPPLIRCAGAELASGVR